MMSYYNVTWWYNAISSYAARHRKVMTSWGARLSRSRARAIVYMCTYDYMYI